MNTMGAKKKQVPGFADPPGPLAPIEDWIEHRRALVLILHDSSMRATTPTPEHDWSPKGMCET
jgi:hypothetical protein